MGIALILFGQSTLWAQSAGSEHKVAPADAAPTTHPTDASVANVIRTSRKTSTPAEQDFLGELSLGEDPDNHLIVPFVKHLATDQRTFWTTPAHFRVNDLKWIAPFAGITAGFMAGDSWISKQIPLGKVQTSKTVSDYGAYSLIAAGGGAFLLGHLTGNDHMSEAGLLSGEAAINSATVAYLLKHVTQRPRPYQATGSGIFFQGGSSFPSEHAAIAWSVASVMAHEYPGTLTKVLAYGLATTISATRVTGQQHFSSDVIIGSALGWYFGRQVYRAHHDTELGGTAWGDLVPESSGDRERNPANMGSPYVPLGSWVYPALERLIALGYIKTGYLGIRPWTRMECARMLEETEQKIADEDDTSAAAPRIYRDLAKEFSAETARLNGAANLGASVDSVYVRTTNVSGPPLRDGYHFGQTIINDYGRPYGEGFNAVAGLTAHAEAGPLSIAIQGEYQYAPAVASETTAVLSATAAVDSTQPLSNASAETNRLRLLQGTIAFTHKNVQISVGQESLWFGSTHAGPLLFSNNAEPVSMLRIDSVAPYEIPFLSRFLGPVRSDFFVGQLSGQKWEFSPVLFGPGLSSQPFLHGTKFSFHPSSNLEMGIAFTAQFGGPGNPVTWRNSLRTFYSHKNATGENPGKRLSEFEFNYRVPGLRNWLQMYADSMVIDEYSPLGSNRPAINPGIYVPQLPKMPAVEIRLEGVTSDLNVPRHFGPGAFYWDSRYRSGYTNNGNLIGSWIGRRGRGEQGWLTYHFSPRNNVQLGYRHNSVDKAFLQGGTLQDFSLSTELMLGKNVGLSGFVQRETWHFPVLALMSQSDVTASLQLTFWPNHRK
jgi:membrane-associated phospholipid phosphatase